MQNKLIANVATIALPPPPPGPLPPLPSSTTFNANDVSSSTNEENNNNSNMYEEEKGETEGDLALVRLLRSQLLEMQQEMKAMKQRRAVKGDGGGDPHWGGNGDLVLDAGEEEGSSSALVRSDGHGRLATSTRSPVMANR